MSRNSNEFWLFVILLLGLPFLMGSKLMPSRNESPQQRKRRRSTSLGLAVLLFFVIGITITKGREWYIERQEEKTAASLLLHQQKVTDALLDTYAKGFSRGNPEMQNQWASGDVKDEWGRCIVLLNNDSKGTQFLSKGPDGEQGTSDDRLSTLYKSNFNAYIVDEINHAKELIAAMNESPAPEKKTGFSIKWPWSDNKKVEKEVQEAVEETKEAVETVGEEIKETGFKIKWPWSKD